MDLLIAAPGFLSEPATPSLPGMEDFEGESFHTARWNHDHDLTGRRVAVIGTGASAIQTVPQIQPIVEQLVLFQRTPPWVMPHRDRPITDFERRLYRRFPALQRAVRTGVYLSREMLVPGFVRNPKLMQLPQRVARRHLEKHVSDPELRARLMPDYSFGCKRVLPSNEWYPAITQPNVSVVTDGIREVRPNGIVDMNGDLHEVDTIVFATGFYVTDVRFAKIVRGRDGALMSDVWNGSPQAYRGTAVAGFPNLFVITGPNTGLGHNSLVYMIEAQLDYLMDAVHAMERRGAARVEVRRGAGRLQRRPAEPHGPHRVELGRLPELVHRRQRQEHHDLAGLHVVLPPPAADFDADAYELTTPATERAPEPTAA